MDNTKRELIKKHLEGWTGLKKSSIDYFATSGKASGTFLMALESMLDEYARNRIGNLLEKAKNSQTTKD